MNIIRYQFDRNKYWAKDRLGAERSPEEILSGRIRLWQANRLGIGPQQIFSIYGKPGMGKSWLLMYLKDTFPCAIYIDLNEREKYSTHITFVNEMENRVYQSSLRREKLLLIDHVPDSQQDDIYLRRFEDNVLHPCIEQGALIIVAQQYPRNWCWSGAIPHTPSPLTLYGFNAQGKKALLRKYNLPTNHNKSAFLELQETSPLLICMSSLLKDDGLVAESYLSYWLEQTDSFAVKGLQQELSLAGALTWLESLADVAGIQDILSKFSIEDMDHLGVRQTLDNRQWTTSLQDEWVEPARTLLQLWLRYNNPEMAKALDQQYKKRR